MSEGAGMAGGHGASAARPPAHTPKQGGGGAAHDGNVQEGVVVENELVNCVLDVLTPIVFTKLVAQLFGLTDADAASRLQLWAHLPFLPFPHKAQS